MKKFTLYCCINPAHTFETKARGIVVARLRAHARGWASTSMDSKNAHDICPECLKRHPKYSASVPFKQSVFAEMERSVIGNG